MLDDSSVRDGIGHNRYPTSAAESPNISETLGGSTFQPLDLRRLRQAKRSYTTRRIDLSLADRLITAGLRPRAGDLALARIERLGHHKRIEDPQGRRGFLYIGDEVLLCYGDRYASDQFEALVPETLGPCHMVAGGGIIAQCVNRHVNTQAPTEVTPLGLVADARGKPLNLADFALPKVDLPSVRPYTIVVVGTSMNSGKTTIAGALVNGLSRAGWSVVAGKATGTGAGGDRWVLGDAGAEVVLDFTDFGYASTYRVPQQELRQLLRDLCAALSRERSDVVVLEVADGLFFPETAELVASETFHQLVDGILVAAGDAMGAVAAVKWLEEHAVEPLAVAGRLTSSPLATREAAQLIRQPIVKRTQLIEGEWIPPRLVERTRQSA
jgi:hypothetical protein